MKGLEIILGVMMHNFLTGAGSASVALSTAESDAVKEDVRRALLSSLQAADTSDGARPGPVAVAVADSQSRCSPLHNFRRGRIVALRGIVEDVYCRAL